MPSAYACVSQGLFSTVEECVKAADPMFHPFTPLLTRPLKSDQSLYIAADAYPTVKV